MAYAFGISTAHAKYLRSGSVSADRIVIISAEETLLDDVVCERTQLNLLLFDYYYYTHKSCYLFM